jgi:hypothetical protein
VLWGSHGQHRAALLALGALVWLGVSNLFATRRRRCLMQSAQFLEVAQIPLRA